VTVPDACEPVHAWRTWRVVQTRRGLRLSSVVHDDVWEPRVEFRATCAHRHGHEAPDATCDCGIYGVRSEASAARYLLGRNDPGDVQRVLGVVSLWGAVFEGVDGWRARFAYPYELWLADEAGDVAAALEAYRVPIHPAHPPVGTGDTALASAWRTSDDGTP
jgi:hypothetical protein